MFVLRGGMDRLARRQEEQDALRGYPGAHARWRLRVLSRLVDEPMRIDTLYRVRFNTIDYPRELTEWAAGGKKTPKPVPLPMPRSTTDRR